jgi:uncharacterized membrane protein
MCVVCVRLLVHQLTRQSTRAEERLQHIRKQAATRSADNQRAVEDLHRQLIDAENVRVQVRTKVERAEGQFEPGISVPWQFQAKKQRFSS